MVLVAALEDPDHPMAYLPHTTLEPSQIHGPPQGLWDMLRGQGKTGRRVHG